METVGGWFAAMTRQEQVRLLKELVGKTAARLPGILFRGRRGNPPPGGVEATDIVQSVFCRELETSVSGDAIGHLWREIDKQIDTLRKRAENRDLPLSQLEENGHVLPDSKTENNSHELEPCEQAIYVQQVRKILVSAPESREARVVDGLFDGLFDGRSPAETAAELKVPVSEIYIDRKKIRRKGKILRKKIDGIPEGDDDRLPEGDDDE
jgi:hypothetical protein